MIEIGIIDIGSGNIFNLIKSLKIFDVNVNIIEDIKGLKKSDALIIPGVGSFKSGVDTMKKSKIFNELQSITHRNKPILGICLGMQLLLTKSYEFGTHEGLNLIPGIVKPIEKQKGWPVPNIGWCEVKTKMNSDTLVNNTQSDKNFYFIHSYYCDIENKDNIIGTINYGDIEIPAIIKEKNIFGCQFHPELSDNSGIQILSNFVDFIKN
tara:strand:+ start:265 stop:891 length:627 start_codon:yes stop_codon:yes gene_type:complete